MAMGILMLMILSFTAAILFYLYQKGLALGAPAYYLGEEGQAGTFLSTAYLLIGSGICLAISWHLVKVIGQENKFRKLFIGLASALVVYAGLLLFYWFLGEQRHGRHFYYFRYGRAAWWISWVAFVGIGGLTVVLWRSFPKGYAARFWLLFGLLFYYTGLDELFKFHERNGNVIARGWLKLSKEHPLYNDMNDVFIVLYGVIAAGLCFTYRKHLLRLRGMMIAMVFAFLSYASTVMWDVMHWGDGWEEALKVVAEAWILVALLAALTDKRLVQI
jgi:hypothetical protein